MQTMKNLNPLQVSFWAMMNGLFGYIDRYQMRRAVRDYKYEVHEGRMTDECNQYLAQLQKDWERHRIKLGVEALRREVSYRYPLTLDDERGSAEPADWRARARTGRLCSGRLDIRE